MASWKERRLGQGGGAASNEGQSFTSRRNLAAGGNDDDAEHVAEFKVVMVGTISVGKTSLACRYVKETFREFVNATIGASYMWKRESIELEPGVTKEVKFSIWDTAGQEQFCSLVPMYFRETDAVVLVVDVTRGTSLEEAAMWLEKVRSYAPPHAVVFVALNKIDNEEKRVLPLADVEKFCAQHAASLQMQCGEVSAKLGTGVHDMFVRIGRACLRRRLDGSPGGGGAAGGGGGAAPGGGAAVGRRPDAVRLSSPRRGASGGNGKEKCKC